MLYVLYNEELGYINDCPTFESKEEAESAAINKCRYHSVMKIPEISSPCNPVSMHQRCLKCARCSATVEKRQAYIKAIKH